MSPRRALICASAALVLSFATAGASASDEYISKDSVRLDAARANAGESVENVRFIRPINGYEILGDHSVLVWETNTKAWLVDVRKSDACRGNDLDNSQSVALKSSMDTMNTRNGYVLGSNQLRCKITQIREVDVPAMRAAERSVASAPAR